MATTNSEAAKQQARLAEEWPRRCGCGKTYCHGSFLQETPWAPWEGLDLRGLRTDAFATFELRNCTCGSTLMAAVEIHDLKEE